MASKKPSKVSTLEGLIGPLFPFKSEWDSMISPVISPPALAAFGIHHGPVARGQACRRRSADDHSRVDLPSVGGVVLLMGRGFHGSFLQDESQGNPTGRRCQALSWPARISSRLSSWQTGEEALPSGLVASIPSPGRPTTRLTSRLPSSDERRDHHVTPARIPAVPQPP